MTFAEHAAQARTKARALGLADCIHYAEGSTRRADALYRVADASGLAWWEDRGGSPYLLADGRMVVVCRDVWFVEVFGPCHVCGAATGERCVTRNHPACGHDVVRAEPHTERL